MDPWGSICKSSGEIGWFGGPNQRQNNLSEIGFKQPRCWFHTTKGFGFNKGIFLEFTTNEWRLYQQTKKKYCNQWGGQVEWSRMVAKKYMECNHQMWVPCRSVLPPPGDPSVNVQPWRCPKSWGCTPIFIIHFEWWDFPLEIIQRSYGVPTWRAGNPEKSFCNHIINHH